MNIQLQEYARSKLLEGLLQLPEEWQNKFKLMYARDNGQRTVKDALAMPTAEVVQKMDPDQLDWAMTQVANSLIKVAVAETLKPKKE